MRDISKLAGKINRKSNLNWLKYIEVKDMLEQLGIENISEATSSEILFSCPFPGHSNGDEKPSCYMNNGSSNPNLTTVFNCKGCGRTGNAVSFVAEHMQISRQKATLELKEHYAPGYKKPKYGSIQKEFDERRQKFEDYSPDKDSIQKIDFRLYDRFRVDWNLARNTDELDTNYMFDRGFSIKDLEDWQIGYDVRSSRLTIPIFDQSGNFVGVKARSWDPERKPKYLCLGDSVNIKPYYGFTPYEKSLVVFGVHKWGEQKTYVCNEGEINVMSFGAIGIPAFCTGGSSVSYEQIQIIKDNCEEVILFHDPDEAGIRSIKGYDKYDGCHKPGLIELLEPFVRVKIAPPHKKDANDYLKMQQTDKLKQLIKNSKYSFDSDFSTAV